MYESNRIKITVSGTTGVESSENLMSSLFGELVFKSRAKLTNYLLDDARFGMVPLKREISSRLDSIKSIVLA